MAIYEVGARKADVPDIRVHMSEGQRRVTTGFVFLPTADKRARTITYGAKCLSRRRFGKPRMLAATFAVRRLEYHSAPAEA